MYGGGDHTTRYRTISGNIIGCFTVSGSGLVFFIARDVQHFPPSSIFVELVILFLNVLYSLYFFNARYTYWKSGSWARGSNPGSTPSRVYVVPRGPFGIPKSRWF